MRVLILYGTTEGHTRKIARFLAEQVARHRHNPTLIDAVKQPSGLDPSNFDGVFIVARIHAGGYHRQIVRFVKSHRDALRVMPAAFVSVSMAAAGHRPNDAQRMAKYAEDFFTKAGWKPEHVHHAAGARLYANHGRLVRWVLGLVDGDRYDTSKNHEFTDWSALRRFADDWITSAAPTPVVVWSAELDRGEGGATSKRQRSGRREIRVSLDGGTARPCAPVTDRRGRC